MRAISVLLALSLFDAAVGATKSGHNDSALDQQSVTDLKAFEMQEAKSVDSLEMQATDAMNQRDYAEAGRLFTEIIKVEKDSARLVHFLINRARCFGQVGQKQDAENDLRTALSQLDQPELKAALSKLAPPAEGYDTLKSVALNNLGEDLVEQGRESEGEPILQEALAIRRRGKSELDCAYTLTSLGACAANLGAYDKAIAFDEEALGVFEKLGQADGAEYELFHFRPNLFSGMTAPVTVQTMINLRRALIAVGRKDDAVRLSSRYLDAFKIFQELHKDHPEWVLALQRHADTLEMVGQDQSAKRVYAQVIAKCVAYNALELASDAVLSLAEIHIKDGELAEAEKLLQTLQKSLGKRRLELTDSIRERQVRIAMRKRNFRKAIDLLDQREAYLKRARGIRVQDWQLFLQRSITARALCGDKGVQTRTEEYLNLKAESLKDLLLWTSEKERLAYVEHWSPLSVACNFGSARDIATALLRWKSIVLRSTAEERHLRASVTARGQADQLAELAKAKALASEVSLRAGVYPAEQDASALKQANLQVELLEKRLAQDERGLVRDCLTEEWSTVAKNVPDRAAFLDFVKFDSLRTEDRQSFYGVIVLKQKGEPTWVNLGAASVIDDAIDRLHRSVTDADSTTQDAQVFSALSTLFDLLIRPIEAYVADQQTLFLCPDDALFRVPFAALIDSHQHVAIERWNIVNVVHGSAFLIPHNDMARTSSKTAIVIGGPNYSFNGPENKPTSLLSITQVDSDQSRVIFLRGQLKTWDTLTGAEQEADGVAELLRASGYTVTLGTADRDEGSEPWLRLQHGFRILHIASHAFAIPAVQQGDHSNESLERIAQTDAMMASGIVLRGGQSSRELWKQNKIPQPSADGVLFAAELAELDWGEVDLVFLSCCDTGSGISRAGEGVLGLRRALELAGVKNSILTLWRQNDESSLMTDMIKDFYSALNSGVDVAAAFNNTQRQLLSNARKSAHDFTDWVDNVGVFVLNQGAVGDRN